MTTLAGEKIRRHRLSQTPKQGRPSLASLIGTSATTLQGWEDYGKRCTDPELINRIAELGIADHADWYRPARCPRCEAVSDSRDAAACDDATCPLKPRVAA